MSIDVGKKIRIAHLIGSLQTGGAERQVSLLASRVDAGCFERHVITFNESADGFTDELPDDVLRYCIRYRKRTAIAALYRLYRYLEKNQIDILHCHMYHAAVKGSIIGRWAGVPVILTSEHGKNTWKKWSHHVLEKHIVNRLVNKRVAVSEDIRALRIRLDGVDENRIMVIPNAVKTDVAVSDNEGACHMLGAVGRLVDAKDYPVLFEAVKILVAKGAIVRLQVAGEGKLRPELERCIGELGMSDYIELVGIQDTEKFLSGIDIFAMSSIREGMPVSLLEAMAHGLPIVATRVGGIPEIIDDAREGLLCDPGNPECLAEKIHNLIQDRHMRIELGKRARERVIENYSLEPITRMWEKLYREELSLSAGRHA